MATIEQRERRANALLSQKPGFVRAEDDGYAMIVKLNAVRGVDPVAEARDIECDLSRNCLKPMPPVHVEISPEPR